MPKIASKFELTLIIRNLETGEDMLLRSKWPSPTAAAGTGSKMMKDPEANVVGFEVRACEQ